MSTLEQRRNIASKLITVYMIITGWLDVAIPSNDFSPNQHP